MAESSIEWTDATWNPVIGCARVSPGCENCYAERMAFRLEAMGQERYVGLTRKTERGRIQWTGTARFVPEVLGAPLKWRKPKRIFVNSMSDLFHHDVTNEQIAAVFGVMAACPQHTFQILTKRPERMVEWFKWLGALRGPAGAFPTDPLLGCLIQATRVVAALADPRRWQDRRLVASAPWPLPNVCLGVSCENQETADERIPLLLQVPAAVRFVSAEPLLEPTDFARWLRPMVVGPSDELTDHMASEGWSFPGGQGDHTGIDWVIVGGESGPKARAFVVPDARSVVKQCKAAGKKVFFKQMGARPMDRNDAGFDGNDGEWPEGTETENWEREPAKRHQGALVRIRLKSKKGNATNEWPVGLRVRELPGVA